MKKKSLVGGVVVPLLIHYGISFFVTMIATAMIMGAKLPQYMDVQAESAQLVMEMTEEILKYMTVITGATSLIAFPVFGWMFARDNKRRAAVGIPAAGKVNAIHYVWIFFLGIAACIALNNLLTLSNLAMFSGSYEEVQEGFYAANIGVQIVCLGILAPLAEEFLFRGVIYKRCREAMQAKRAILINALIFGIWHGNLVQCIYGGILGFVMAYIYEKYGSIKAPIFAHIVLNLTSVLLSEAGGFAWMFAEPMRMGIVTVVCAAVASTAFVMIQRVETEK